MGEQIAHFFCGPRHLVFVDGTFIDVVITQIVIVGNKLVALVDDSGKVFNWEHIKLAEKRST